MANPLLDRVLPADLADRSQVIEYEGRIGDFERLREISESEFKAVSTAGQPRDWQDSPLAAQLEFGWLDTARRLAVATGRVTAVMPVVCQRCLETFGLVIDTPVRFVFGEPGSDLEQFDYDAWEIDGQAILLQDIVEESVVMALPLAPRHDSASQCGTLPEHEPKARPEMTTPFADLQERMAAKDN